jgi:hypothetical protein
MRGRLRDLYRDRRPQSRFQRELLHIGASVKFRSIFLGVVSVAAISLASVAPAIAEDLVRITNHWKPNESLNIEHSVLRSGPVQPGWFSARWYIEEGPDGFVRFRNYWKPTKHIHNQRGRAESGVIQPGWWSAMWTIEDVPGTDFVRLRNRWKPDEYLNIEHGRIESGPIQPGWWSAMWTLEPVDE